MLADQPYLSFFCVYYYYVWGCTLSIINSRPTKSEFSTLNKISIHQVVICDPRPLPLGGLLGDKLWRTIPSLFVEVVSSWHLGRLLKIYPVQRNCVGWSRFVVLHMKRTWGVYKPVIYARTWTRFQLQRSAKRNVMREGKKKKTRKVRIEVSAATRREFFTNSPR